MIGSVLPAEGTGISIAVSIEISIHAVGMHQYIGITWVHLLIAASVMLLFVGIDLARRGLWPRRQGNDPYCRKCGYMLVGLTGDRCPECGSLLSALAIIHGRRERRPRVVGLGFTLIILGLLAGLPIVTGFYRTIDWYKYKPTNMVISDLENPSNIISDRAWAELMRRDADRGLSDSHYTRIIETALRQQTAATPAPFFVQALMDYAYKKADEAQKKRMLDQAVRISLQVRPTVLLGENVPYILDQQSRGPSSWWKHLAVLSANVDGEKPRSGSIATSGNLGGGTMGQSVPVSTAGNHKLRIIYRLRIHERENGPMLSQKEVELTGEFKVVERLSPGPATTVADTELNDRVRAAVKPEQFEYRSPRPQIGGIINFTNPPAAMAFDVFVKYDGVEYKLGSIHAKSGVMSSYYSSSTTPLKSPAPQRVDVILRSSDTAARNTVDLTDIWHGELIFPNVPVKDLSVTQP